MRIADIHTRTVEIPLERPLRAAVADIDRIVLLLIDATTDGGLVGRSYLWPFTRGGARAVTALIQDLAPRLRGRDPRHSAALWRDTQRALTLFGHQGLAALILSGLDVCWWDLTAKAAGQPLAHLLGMAHERVPVYASEGLWLRTEPEALELEAAEMVERGFRAVKLRLGRPTLEEDLEAVHAVHAALPADVALLTDANQAWDVPEALRRGRALQEAGVAWLEEPIVHDDLAGQAELCAALAMPITVGENTYLPRGFQELIERRAVDIVMPDLERVGGVTGWLRTATLAELERLPLCSHLFPEVSVHLLAASPSALYLEHMPWADSLLVQPLQLEDGQALVPTTPGVGLEWNEAAVERYLIDR